MEKKKKRIIYLADMLANHIYMDFPRFFFFFITMIHLSLFQNKKTENIWVVAPFDHCIRLHLYPSCWRYTSCSVGLPCTALQVHSWSLMCLLSLYVSLLHWCELLKLLPGSHQFEQAASPHIIFKKNLNQVTHGMCVIVHVALIRRGVLVLVLKE